MYFLFEEYYTKAFLMKCCELTESNSTVYSEDLYLQ